MHGMYVLCVCVYQRKNYKISHRSFVLTWSSSKLHAYCSSLGITCLGKDEATLMLANQFCPLLLVFLLRCFCSCLCLLNLVQVFPWWPGCSHRESLRNWLTVTWEKICIFPACTSPSLGVIISLPFLFITQLIKC